MAKLNKMCNVCGDDNWHCIDNPDEYSEWCLTCLNNKQKTMFSYLKNDYVDNFECPDCGGLSGTPEENNKKFGVRCNNCGKLTICFEKYEGAVNNRNKAEEWAARDKKFADIRNGKICPKCGSDNVSTGQRGYSIMTGFLGSGRTMNRCGKCGYKWYPGK